MQEVPNRGKRRARVESAEHRNIARVQQRVDGQGPPDDRRGLDSPPWLPSAS